MSQSPTPVSAAEFAQSRQDLPESGRWHELHDGIPFLMSAPDDAHGNIVLNLSRMLASWLTGPSKLSMGYACYELGIHVRSNPDTVYFPAISWFQGGLPFSQTDLTIATEIPKLVVDVASSNDRRRDMRLRTTSYLQLGVEVIWIPDPFKKEVQVIRRKSHTLALGSWQTLDGDPLLPGFRIPVEKIFAEPSWWDGKLPDYDVVAD